MTHLWRKSIKNVNTYFACLPSIPLKKAYEGISFSFGAVFFLNMLFNTHKIIIIYCVSQVYHYQMIQTSNAVNGIKLGVLSAMLS